MIAVAFHKSTDHLRGLSKIIPKVIKWWTKSEYFHVEVIVNGVSARTAPFLGLDTYLRNTEKDNNSGWDIIYFPTKSSINKEILDFVRQEEGSGYDWLGIFLAQFFNAKREHPDKWFCSELTSKILEMAGHKKFQGIEHFAQSPQDVYEKLKTN